MQYNSRMPPKDRRSRSRSSSKKKKEAATGGKSGGKSSGVAKRSPPASPLKAPPRSSSTTPRSPRTATRSLSEAFTDEKVRIFTPEKDVWDGKYEFGGPFAVLLIILFSHFIMYYLYICVEVYAGTIIYPGHKLLSGKSMVEVFMSHIERLCIPTPYTFALFLGFLLMQYLIGRILPGVTTQGLPIPSENGYRLTYKCNAAMSWLVILAGVGVAHYTGLFDLTYLRYNFGRFLTTGVILGDLFSTICYFWGLKRAIRTTPSVVYNFFMGSQLNYCLPGNLEIKLFFECRNSWVLLMILTLSCACAQYRELGYITNNMIFMITAHFLYSNAVQKGEECVVTTWDIFYEKFGWMLCFWNTAGVPFVYCLQSLYIQTVLKDKQYSTPVIIFMITVLLIAYYIWDTANSQKNRFRMQRMGIPEHVLRRRTFPQLAWNFIEHPKYLESSAGTLFVDGWYRYARKLHYTTDILMAFLWGASCGFESLLPFYYVLFFTLVLVDRERRDMARCRQKYGKLWDEYTRLVPYRFIPYIW